MPLYVKGGAWTNVEDEILKAAVSKYGLNQWARVSSLLTKKSAKQAKARWNEWLNPTINKSAWTREDDDKLLLLAKIMPHQWQSIAPIMGRTAASCSDRYNLLIDGSVAVAQAGDVNLNAELQPARPDEADDEEMELLAEAKARLANTQGKKAQRKARERMLRETLRVSQLQKRHELKQAGVSMRLKYSEAELNHIPHERTPQAGVYDTADEQHNNEKDLVHFDRKVARTGMEDGKKRKKPADDRDLKEQKEQKKQQVAMAADAVSAADAALLKRRKLNLPGPGEGATEEEIDKNITSSVDRIRSRMDERSALMPLSIIPSGGAKTMGPVSKTASESSQLLSKSSAKSAKKDQKRLRQIVAQHLSSLPPPLHHPGLTLPKFEAPQETISTAIAEDEGERLRMLATLRLVDEEKAKLRRSQAVQRGLTVPNPNSILKARGKGVEREIMDELRKLVSSDYKKYEDPRFNAVSVDDLDEDTYERIHNEIDEELKTAPSSDSHPKMPPMAELKPFSKAMTEAYRALAGENDVLRLELTEKANEKLQELILLVGSIVDAAAKHVQVTTDVTNYEKILAEETIAIESRSARLHELVEGVVCAEHEIADRIKATL